MLLGPIVWILTVVICYIFIGHYWWFPPPISQHGQAYDAQFTVTLWVTGIIFFWRRLPWAGPSSDIAIRAGSQILARE
jgi:hypothetical protein